MATAQTATERPASPEEAAALLKALGEQGRTVRIRGGGTKLDWGGAAEPAAVELETAGLDAVVEHNVGDFTAILQAGVPLARAQDAFQRLRCAFDPAGLANPGKLMPTPRLCGEVPGPYRQHPLEAAGLAERF